MKRSMLLLGMLLTFDAFAQAQYLSGNKLLNFCSKIDGSTATFEDGICAGFIAGVADSMAERSSGTRTCLSPGGIPLSQIVAVSVKYLRDNPAVLHHSAFTNVSVALSLAFPCKE